MFTVVAACGRKIWANQEYSCITARRTYISTYRSPFSLGPRTIKSEPGKKVVWKLLWALKAQDNFMDNRIRHF